MPGGGHGGIEFDKVKGTLTKPTNQVEIDFLDSIHDIPSRGSVLADAPYPLITAFKQLKNVVPDYYGSGVSKDGDKTVTIGNIGHGLTSPRFMDVKIGAATVSKKELLASGAKGTMGAWWKKRKLEATDWYLNSSTR